MKNIKNRGAVVITVEMRVFLAPGLFKNIKRSIVDGVGVGEMDSKDALLKEEVAKRYGDKPVKLWGLKETLRERWATIETGDYVLFYHARRITHVGRVSFKYPFTEKAEQEEAGSRLAEIVWGRDVDGRTWPYLFFLEDVREIDIPLSKLNELTGYRLKAVAGFMGIRKDKALRLVKHLQQIYTQPPVKPAVEQPSELTHEEIVNAIYALGELIGYRPEKKWRHEKYEFDVVWHRPPRIGPKYVFEVHLKGSLEAALLRLKHAHDLWESKIFLVSTEDQLKEARLKFLGELHEIKDEVTLLDIRDVEEFYSFKGRFEWLERRFGLRPS